jgi:hypothetical protein
LDSYKDDPRLNPGTPGQKYITCFDPSIGLFIDTFVADSAETIAQKIEAAERAQESWKKTTFAERKRVVRSLNKWLVENQEVCARVACRDTGKTCRFFSFCHPIFSFWKLKFATSDRRGLWRNFDDLFKDGVAHRAWRKSLAA